MFVEPIQGFTNYNHFVLVELSFIQQSMNGVENARLEMRVLINFWSHKSDEWSWAGRAHWV